MVQSSPKSHRHAMDISEAVDWPQASCAERKQVDGTFGPETGNACLGQCI